ncbi:MAG: J domain-containing protein [Spirochaetota bacterium]|nr:MAG: J domain-containing protein [Spirochaetota bacterium]
MESLRDAYKILGVPINSSIRVVREAYRKLAKKYHPDSNPHEPEHSHAMMMKINDAYEIIKWHQKRGIWVEERVYSPYDEMLKRWERERAQEREAKRRSEERRQREQEAFQRFWERVTLERKYELGDKKYFDSIVRYARAFLSFYYGKNLHNFAYRERPYGSRLYSEYEVRFNRMLDKGRQLARLSKSERYRKKSNLVLGFLKTFIDDTKRIYSPIIERRAQALRSFEKALYGSDKFIGNYFTHENTDREQIIELFKKSLDGFEYFLKAYPESSLIEYAQSRLGVLEFLYRAFIRD